jgi:hypothetical protein
VPYGASSKFCIPLHQIVPSSDPLGTVIGRRNGERVAITVDSRRKASLVDHASNCLAVGLVTTPEVKLPFEAEMQLKKQMEFTAEPQPSHSAEIANYIDRLGKLYSHCLTTAANMRLPSSN